ncbi:MAG: hypothetical protein ACPGTQ_05095 [Colwellia sp.]
MDNVNQFKKIEINNTVLLTNKLVEETLMKLTHYMNSSGLCRQFIEDTVLAVALENKDYVETYVYKVSHSINDPYLDAVNIIVKKFESKDYAPQAYAS